MQNSPINNYQQVNANPNQIPQPCTVPTVNIQPAQQAPMAYGTDPQSFQVPNYSGVNIQIFNPSVGAPGGAPVYNVNAPNYTNPSCYPQNYYTQELARDNNSGNGNNGGSGNDSNVGKLSNGSNTNATNTTNTTVNSNNEKKITKEVVQLTDDYIKSIENYLNSQDKEIRMMGAKEVANRLQEDKTRRDDKALTALINKMLQDPYQPVRFLALAMLDGRFCTGDDYTVKVLQNMQQTSTGYGQDALQASEILLRMTGKTVKKEFNPEDVYPEPKKKKDK